MRASLSKGRFGAALWIDEWVGPVLCGALLPFRALRRSSRPLPEPEDVRRVLIVKPWGMGSIVLTAPALRELRRRYPGAQIDFLTLRENAEILAGMGIADAITLDLSRGVARFLIECLRTIVRLRRSHYDLLFDFEFFTRFSSLFSFLVAPRVSFGFSAKGSMRGRLHDVEIPFNSYNHVALNFLSMLRGRPVEPLPDFDVKGPNVLPRLELDTLAVQRVEQRLADDARWQPGRPLVVINPNAGDMALERRWPEEQMVAFLEQVCGYRDWNLVLTGSPSEKSFVESLLRLAGAEQRAISLAGEIEIPELVALLGRADVFVTNDSGPLHIAAAAGTSTVALFGPETPTLYGPLRSRPGQRHIVHYQRLACSPCMFVHENKVLSCWFAKARCMSGIEPSEVLSSVDKLLAERPSV